jgi:hypothetical protein
MSIQPVEVERELEQLIGAGVTLGDALRILHHERHRGLMLLWPAVMASQHMAKDDAMRLVVRETSHSDIRSRPRSPAKLLSFDEAFSPDVTFGVPVRAIVSGYLVVTYSFSYLLAAREQLNFSSDQPENAILLADSSIVDRFLETGCPFVIGRMVLFCGPAQVTGNLKRSGFGQFPVAFTTFEEIVFTNSPGEQYVISNTPC